MTNIAISAAVGLWLAIFWGWVSYTTFKDIVKEGAKLRNYEFYGVSSALHLCAAVMIVMFYILDCPKAATAIGAALGVFWTIILFLAYKKTKADFDYFKKQIDE